MTIFSQLCKGDLPTLSSKQLCQLGGLLYDTDSFIFPAAFGDRETAIKILTALISQNVDSMFSIDRFFVAETEHGDFVGLILWIKGPLKWSAEHLRTVAQTNNLVLPSSFQNVYKEYFSRYHDTPDQTVAILNVCVTAKQRGKGIGTQMMSAFCQALSRYKMELCTLANNTPAVRLYEKLGFFTVDQIAGFALGPTKPDCLVMARKSTLAITPNI